MTSIAIICGSPAANSRTRGLAVWVRGYLESRGIAVGEVIVRAIPAEALLGARAEDTALRNAIDEVLRADGVVVVTPVYNAAYPGILKAFLDSLPQFGLSGKVVLPVAIGGSLAHLLSIDYAMRPVLSCLGALHITQGAYFCADQVEFVATGGLRLEVKAEARLLIVLEQFERSVRSHGVDRIRAQGRALEAVGVSGGAEVRGALVAQVLKQ